MTRTYIQNFAILDIQNYIFGECFYIMNYIYSSLNKKNVNKGQTKTAVFFILISLTILQQMPVVKDMFYNEIRIFLYFAFGIFSIIALFSINQFSKIPFIRYFIITIIYTLLFFFIVKAYGYDRANVFELLIPFGVLICSLNTNFRNSQLSIILLWYVLLSLILGISSIFYYGDGFTITSNYFLAEKNQIGPLLGISTIITGIWVLNEEQFNIRYDTMSRKSTN